MLLLKNHLCFHLICFFIFTAFLFCEACASKHPEKKKEEVTQTIEPSQDSFPVKMENLSMTDFLTGRFDPADHPDFVEIDSHYSDREGMYLQKEAYDAFLEMYEAAVRAGIQLQIRSATRNFEYQKGIWERKWTGLTLIEDKHNAMEKFPEPIERAKQILRYSAMPGSSRHHWGTDIDLNAFSNEWFESGEGEKLFNWLLENAHRYGYCQPYTSKDNFRPHGYEEEKWHWSYVPLASDYQKATSELLSADMIQGFMGSQTSVDVNILEHYILGTNPECVP